MSSLNEFGKLDAVAEEVGGYVLPPWKTKTTPEGRENFSKLRQYSIRNKKPISEFTDADYEAAGVKRVIFEE